MRLLFRLLRHLRAELYALQQKQIVPRDRLALREYVRRLPERG
jgi:hypothetical protein